MSLSLADACTAAAIINVRAKENEEIVRELVKQKSGLIDTAAILSNVADEKFALAERIMASVA